MAEAAEKPTIYEQMDLDNQRHEHQMEVKRQEAEAQIKIAKVQRTKDRVEGLGYVVLGIVVLGIILGITFAIYKGTRPSPYTDGETKREEACVAHGGGFVPKDLLKDGTDHGLCVYPGVRP